MEEKHFDQKQIEQEMKENEERILMGKSPEEQQRLRKIFDELRKSREEDTIKTNELIKKEAEKNEKELKEMQKNTDEILKGMDEMFSEMDAKYDKTFKEAVESLYEGKTEEEQEKIRKIFEKINEDNVRFAEKMEKASFKLDYNYSDKDKSIGIVIMDDFISVWLDNKKTEYNDKSKAEKIKQLALSSAKKIKDAEKGMTHLPPLNNDIIDFISITTKERIYHLTGRANEFTKKEYDFLVKEIFKILELYKEE